MPTFTYVAKDKAGKIHRGEKEADNEQDALQQITNAGYEVTKIRDSSEQIASPMERLIALNETASQFISSQEVQTFTRALVESLSQGQLLDAALQDLAAKQQNEHFR